MHLASETLAGAHAVSATLTGDQANELMHSATQAFEGGTSLMAWATFSLAVLAILVAKCTLKTPNATHA
jgi:DHA2 family multidrug resistance protein-like MFS transporter